MSVLPGGGGTAFYAGHGIKADTHANAVANQYSLCNSSGQFYYEFVWSNGYSNNWSFTISNNVVTDLAADTPHGFVASSSTATPATGANASSDYPATGTVTISATNKYLHIFDASNDRKFYVDVSSLVTSSTSSESVATTTASLSGSLSLYVNNLEQRFVVYTIDATCPTTSTANGLYDVRYTLKDGTTGRVFQPNSINHTNLTATTANFGLFLNNDTPDGLYELIHIGSSLNSFPVTVLASIKLRIGGKVHSNFW